MAALTWNTAGERRYETGVDRGVLFLLSSAGLYDTGYAWVGLTGVTESPSGAESNKQYADNMVYANLISAEEFGATVEAFHFPDAFYQCDGTATPQPGLAIGQQNRATFALCYRTKVGDDLSGGDAGYKLHLIYGALAAPSERAYATVNDSPEAMTFSWEISTTPVDVPGTNPATGKSYKPTSIITVDSTKVAGADLSALENILYGTAGVDPRMPLPEEVLALFAGSVTIVAPTAPTYDSGTKTITIPTVTGVTYKINGLTVTDPVVITKDTVVKAYPNAGYQFPAVTDDDWLFKFA